MTKHESDFYNVRLSPKTRFLLSTSGNKSSIEKHNSVLQKLGINLAYFTFSREISAKDYTSLLRSPIVRGGAVTGQGLKSSIIPFLDKVDELAVITNSVNTVVNRNGILHGYNTDSYGLEDALRKHLNKPGLNIKNAIIYGNGGVSGAAAYTLQNLGIKRTMTGRNPDKVIMKMKQLKIGHEEGPYDLVVNATPASSGKIAEAPGLLEILQDARVVFDHNMPEKNGSHNYLSEYCNQRGIYFIPGSEMYAGQMKRQWRQFLDGYRDENGKTWSVSEDNIVKLWQLAE